MLDDPADEDDLDRERRRWRERKRASRKRECNGLEQYTIELPRDALAEALLNSEQLTESEALDHEAVEGRITEIMNQWIERWEK